jgi:anti-sigma regulatory factor (Ser/Thr protein kinase)
VILTHDKIDDRSARDLIHVATKAHQANIPGLTFDFTKAKRAYPEGMVQLIGHVEYLRSSGMHFDVIPPADRTLNRLFGNCNWLSFLAPTMFDPQPPTDTHLPVQRFANASEQASVVNQMVEMTLRQLELERSVIGGIEWALNEITDNVLNHANAPAGGVAQLQTFRDAGRIQIAVADTGRGILSSMKEGFPSLKRDTDAIAQAMKQGVTRSAAVGQGNGLAGALRLAVAANGSFTLISGRGEVKVLRPPRAREHRHESFGRPEAERLHGTFVFLELRTDSALDLEAALDFGKGGGILWDYVDANYSSTDGAVRLVVAEEVVGVGSRHAGDGLRTKIKNLLAADPGSSVVLDWRGIEIPSSSFADEVVGRLYVELGPLGFNRRMQLENLAPGPRRIVERVMLQRAAQALGEA